MPGAVDPTYPLYPITNVLSSVMLLLVLMTSFVRQSWNLGVTFLCFWLLLENVTSAMNAIIWSDNADLKLYVYCDIVSHLQEATYVVKPMATLIIIRRLYLIASLRSVELPSKAARRRDLAVEWTLGLMVPILVAGPFYYVNQSARFGIYEGFGCSDAEDISILEILIEDSWTIVPPLVSLIFYYPKVARTYYRQSRDINSFLGSNPSVSQTNYLRILALASIDILLTLPISIVNTALGIVYALSPPTYLPFYPGWTFLHTDWEPRIFPYAQLQATGTANLAVTYFALWSSPVLAFAIFGLFGVTPEARASYWRIICPVGGWLGWKPAQRARNEQASLGNIEFGARQQNASGFDLEMGSRTPSFINADAPAVDRDAERALNERAAMRNSQSSVESTHPEENAIAKTEDIEGNISVVEVREKSTRGSRDSSQLVTGQDGEISDGSTPRRLDPNEAEAADRTFGDSDNRANKAGQSTAA